MLRLTAAYIAGALTVAVAVYAAGGRATLAAFGIGFFLAVLVAVALLSSGRRLKRAARFLFALSHALERDQRRSTRTPTAPGTITIQPKPVEVIPAPVEPSPEEEAIYAALLNLGSPKRAARAAAHYAIEQAPAASFNEQFRIAVAARKQAA